MPELPEVETVKNTLKKLVLNKKIIDTKIIYPKMIEFPTEEEFKNQIKNQTILDIKRKGKWLMFELNNYYLLSHLRMEGKYILKQNNDPIEKHEHICFIFNDGSELRYVDTRKFGRMHLIKKEEVYNQKPLNELGLEPWDKELNVKYLKDKYANKTIAIKTTLLDQSIIVGIGNIYADEILYLSYINPLKKSKSLTNKELENILKNTKKVLEKAIELGGTTIRTYTSAPGIHGRFQNELLVHNQNTCPNCKKELKKIKIKGRTTYYCSKCQK